MAQNEDEKIYLSKEELLAQIESKGFSHLQKILEVNKILQKFEVKNLEEMTGKKQDLMQFTMQEANIIRKAIDQGGDDPISN